MRFFLFVFILICAQAQAFSPSLQTTSFSEVAKGIDAFLVGKKVESTLIVYDLDDTLLSTDQSLGGEGWFMWQENKVFGKVAEDRVVEKFDELLELQNRLLGLIKFRPVEPNIPEVVESFQKRGFASLICTSRGFNEMNSTIRELTRNGLDFSKSKFAEKAEAYKPYAPYDLKKITASGLSTKDIAEFKLEVPRTVGFVKGVFFTEGQNKGIVLRTLFHRVKMPVTAMVYVDNRLKHHEKMTQAFGHTDLKLYTVHYNKVNWEVPDYSQASGKDPKGDFQRLQYFLK